MIFLLPVFIISVLLSPKNQDSFFMNIDSYLTASLEPPVRQCFPGLKKDIFFRPWSHPAIPPEEISSFTLTFICS